MRCYEPSGASLRWASVLLAELTTPRTANPRSPAMAHVRIGAVSVRKANEKPPGRSKKGPTSQVINLSPGNTGQAPSRGLKTSPQCGLGVRVD